MKFSKLIFELLWWNLGNIPVVGHHTGTKTRKTQRAHVGQMNGATPAKGRPLDNISTQNYTVNEDKFVNADGKYLFKV